MDNMKVKNLYHQLRHFGLANWLILKYSFKSIDCMAQGDHKQIDIIRIDEVVTSKTIGTLPLSIWDYDILIEIAKKIRAKLWKDSAIFISFEVGNFTANHLNKEHTVKLLQYVSEFCGYTVKKSGSKYELISVL